MDRGKWYSSKKIQDREYNKDYSLVKVQFFFEKTIFIREKKAFLVIKSVQFENQSFLSSLFPNFGGRLQVF
ncbi:MAG: hypothetical protein DCF12_17015 [Snowella sp.]|nr:MAG: hypothetical protein DCF12_17015 [Snowella sp.]